MTNTTHQTLPRFALTNAGKKTHLLSVGGIIGPEIRGRRFCGPRITTDQWSVSPLASVDSFCLVCLKAAIAGLTRESDRDAKTELQTLLGDA